MTHKFRQILLTIVPFLGLASVLVSFVDSSVELIINPTFNNQTLMESAWYMSSKNDSIQITDVRFYLTDFQLKTVAGKIRSIENSNYLIDVFKPETLNILLDKTFFGRGDVLSFNLGVSSAMNTSCLLYTSPSPRDS